MRTKPETDYPKMDVAALIQRASDIRTACRRDRKGLAKAGLDWKKVEAVDGLIRACSEKEAEYGLQKEAKARETARLLEYVQSCARLRRDAAESAGIALSNAGAGIKTPVVRGGRSRVDLVQDLSDIAVFCRIHADCLEKGRFDSGIVEKAERTVKELSGALAEAELRKRTPSAQLEERNKICRELYKKCMELCRLGRMVFKNDVLRYGDYIFNKKS